MVTGGALISEVLFRVFCDIEALVFVLPFSPALSKSDAESRSLAQSSLSLLACNDNRGGSDRPVIRFV
jgi:hypothetical protein